MINDFIYTIGNFAPFLISTLSLYLLWNKQNFLHAYIIGLIIDFFVVNNVLKHLIKDPRPSEDIALFYAKKTHAYDLLNSQQYGMPSGHAQNLFYSFIFILLTLKNVYISSFYFLLTLISLCQRILYKYHTPLQIVIGCIIGMIIGYTTYNLTTKKIAQNTNIKDDKHSISKYVNN